MPTPITPDLVELRRLYEVGKTPDGGGIEWKVQSTSDTTAYLYCDAFPRDIFAQVSGEKRREVAELIVAAHNAFPALIAAVEERDRLAKRVAVIEAEALERAAKSFDADQNYVAARAIRSLIPPVTT